MVFQGLWLVIQKRYDRGKGMILKEPELKDRGGDLSKRWYIQYWYLSRSKKEIVTKRLGEIKGVLTPNREKSKAERNRQFADMMEALKLLLNAGWDPEAPVDKEWVSEKILLEKPTSAAKTFNEVSGAVVAINPRLKQRTEDFNHFLEEKGLSDISVMEIKRPIITEYLQSVKARPGIGRDTVSNITVNNYINDVKTIFNILTDDLDVIPKNPAKSIKKLKEVVEKNVTFTPEQLKAILNWCKLNEPYLFDFLMYMGFGFLRPIEILKLQADQVDLNRKVIYLNAKELKGKKSAVMRIIDRLMPFVADKVEQCEHDSWYLFGIENKPSAQRIASTEFFSNRFNTCKDELNKQGFNFTSNHKMYSARHTFARDVYNGLRRTMTKQEATYELMLLMRHASPKVTADYIRDYSFEVAKDWGENYSLEV